MISLRDKVPQNLNTVHEFECKVEEGVMLRFHLRTSSVLLHCMRLLTIRRGQDY